MRKSFIFSAMLALCLQSEAMHNDSEKTSLEHLEDIKRAVADGANANTLMDLVNDAIGDVANYANPADGANKAIQKLINANSEKNPRLAEIYKNIAKKQSPANEYKGKGIFRSNSQEDLVGYVKAEGQKTYAQEVDVLDAYEDWLDVMEDTLKEFNTYKTSTGVNLSLGQLSRLDELEQQIRNLRNPTEEISNNPENTEQKSKTVESQIMNPDETTNKSDLQTNNAVNARIENFIRDANQNPDTIFPNIQNIRNELGGHFDILNEENSQQLRNLITRVAVRPDLVDHLENLIDSREYFSHDHYSEFPCFVDFGNDQFATILARVAAWCYGSENSNICELEHTIDSLDVEKCNHGWVKPRELEPGNPLEILAYVSFGTNVRLRGIIDDLDMERYECPVYHQNTPIDILDHDDQITVLSAMLFAMLNAHLGSKFFFHDEQDKIKFKSALKAITGRLIVLLAR